MDLYEFIILYQPGKENFLADFLLRLKEETPAEDTDKENDYHDQLVASIQVLSIDQTFNVHNISREPNSENQNEYIVKNKRKTFPLQ